MQHPGAVDLVDGPRYRHHQPDRDARRQRAGDAVRQAAPSDQVEDEGETSGPSEGSINLRSVGLLARAPAVRPGAVALLREASGPPASRRRRQRSKRCQRLPKSRARTDCPRMAMLQKTCHVRSQTRRRTASWTSSAWRSKTGRSDTAVWSTGREPDHRIIARDEIDSGFVIAPVAEAVQKRRIGRARIVTDHRGNLRSEGSIRTRSSRAALIPFVPLDGEA